MPAFRHVELVADTGRHRLAIINQQADYLGLISWDGHGYVYERHNEPVCSCRAMEAAQKILPERDREILSEEPVELPEDFPPSWRALTNNDRWARVTRVFREDPEHAYDVLVTSWRAQAHQGDRDRARGALPRRLACGFRESRRTTGRMVRGRAWREVLAEPGAAPHALARLVETQHEDVEAPYLRTAIMAELERDPSSAFDRLAPHIEARGETFFLAVVDVLFRDRSDALRGRASARDWFGADPRWRERLEPLARLSPRSSTDDPPDEQIAALAYELVHRVSR